MRASVAVLVFAMAGSSMGQSFWLERADNGTSYGPFALKEGATAVLDGVQYRVRIKASTSQPAPLSPSAADEYSDSEATIKTHCEREWPEDFQMRAYCQEQQREGVATLKQGRPSDVTADQFRLVRGKCAKEWADDFQMRAYCEKQQWEAIRKLKG